MISTSHFVQRRHRLLAQMLPASAALFFAAPEQRRSRDTEYHFRQNSDFWYFTGFNEPQALLLLMKSESGQTRSVIFNRFKDKQAEIWSGRRLGQQAALAQLAVDHAFSYEQIEQQLPMLLNGLQHLYLALGDDELADKQVHDALHRLHTGSRQNLHAPTTLHDWRPLVHEMRLFKDDQEIALIRHAAHISAKGHLRAMQQVRVGMWEYQLEGEILHEFSQHGARFAAYNSIVGGGENACILHYTENEQRLQDGSLVLIDAGCEYQGYAGDITRTLPVNGRFTPPQRQIYQLVLRAMQAALDLFKPGETIHKINQTVIRIMVEGLVELGILQGEVDQLIEDKAYLAFYMHGLSHWLGLDVHDVGDYHGTDRSRTLEPGMVLTVEPGLYIASDADVPAQYRGIGVRIEDDILITATGHDNLTASVPKDADQIEAIILKHASEQ